MTEYTSTTAQDDDDGLTLDKLLQTVSELRERFGPPPTPTYYLASDYFPLEDEAVRWRTELVMPGGMSMEADILFCHSKHVPELRAVGILPLPGLWAAVDFERAWSLTAPKPPPPASKDPA